MGRNTRLTADYSVLPGCADADGGDIVPNDGLEELWRQVEEIGAACHELQVAEGLRSEE